jgi:arabinan endo-1,5-alpha-L-arabinosidase
MITYNPCGILSTCLLIAILSQLSGCSDFKSKLQTAVTYTNPVCAANVPDPSVKKFGEYYYCFGTTGGERLPDGRIFTVWRSHNLTQWEPLGGALVPPSNDTRYQYWAPEIAENNGKYYLYYAMGGVEPEHFVLRVGISDQPQGPFTDSGVILTDCESNRFTIDPYPFRDDDGQWYLFYAVDFPYESPGLHAGTGIVADRLINMTRLAGERRVIVRAAHDWTLFEANRRMDIFNQTFNWHTIEGPCVVKHDGKYYCFYSGANWQTPRYGVDYVVADKPLGPYAGAGDHARVLHGVPGQVIGPGGNAIATGPDGKTQYIIYHAWNKPMTERQLCIDPLDWTADGPRATATVTPQEMR